MATTTNYGWTTPDDTALVKDGASAIRSLGTSVDTTTKALNPSTTLGDIEYRSSTANTNTRLGIGSSGQALTVVAGVPSWAASATSVLTTTGDLLYASAANTLARRAIGSTGDILTVSGGLPTWAAPVSSGGWTQLASGTLSGSLVSISSISNGYRNLHLVITGAYRTSASGIMLVRCNSNSNNQYYNTWVGSATTITIGGATSAWQFVNAANDINSTANSYARIWSFDDYNNTNSYRLVRSYGGEPTSGYRMQNIHELQNSAAISSIELAPSSGTFGGGNYTLYGEK